jgi:hypothetical protein
MARDTPIQEGGALLMILVDPRMVSSTLATAMVLNGIRKDTTLGVCFLLQTGGTASFLWKRWRNILPLCLCHCHFL